MLVCIISNLIWDPHMQICFGIEEGLSCLQNNNKLSVIHRDIKRPFFSSRQQGAGIDLSLSIVDGKIGWDLYIEGLVINMDGNVLDAFGAAIKAAISNTWLPKVNVPSATSCDEQPELVVSDDEVLRFDTTAIPVIVTITNVGWHRIVDATSEEESSSMGSAVSFAINRRGRICGVIKRGGAGLDPSVINHMEWVASLPVSH